MTALSKQNIILLFGILLLMMSFLGLGQVLAVAAIPVYIDDVPAFSVF